MKAIFKRKIEISEGIDGSDLAELFWSMSDDHQAWFFNRLGEKEGLAMQLQYVTDNDDINQSGRAAMETIGDYCDKLTAGAELLEALKILEESASSVALEDNSTSNLQANALRNALKCAREAIAKAEGE